MSIGFGGLFLKAGSQEEVGGSKRIGGLRVKARKCDIILVQSIVLYTGNAFTVFFLISI